MAVVSVESIANARLRAYRLLKMVTYATFCKGPEASMSHSHQLLGISNAIVDILAHWWHR